MTLDILPKPNEAFEWVQASAGQALICRPLARVTSHLFTTRRWPLGSTSSADRAEGWADVADALGVDRAHLVRVHQVHGAAVVVVRRGSEASSPCGAEMAWLPDADIIVSDDPARAIAIQTADCVPLLVADRRTGAIAAAHAGWRGLAARVPGEAVQWLSQEFGSRPADLLAAIGPSIGACCYEVGGDVRARFDAAGFSRLQLERWFVGEPRPSGTNPSMPGLPPTRRAGHWFFDGWAATCDQLASAGVPPAQMYVAELCAASHADAFCSYRRDGSHAGRLAGAIRARNYS
jgi:YfiH family protein